MPPSPSPFPTPTPLTPDELDYLDSVLESGGSLIANVEMLDGFFAALVTGPEFLMPRQYLPYLLGPPDEKGIQAAPLIDLDEANHFLQLLMQHWNLQVSTFMESQPWTLVLDLDSPRRGHDWAMGFGLGAELQNGWGRLSNAQIDLLGSVAWLAADGGGRPGKKRKITEPEREAMLEAIAHGLPRLYAETRPDARPRPKRPVKRARRKGGKSR